MGTTVERLWRYPVKSMGGERLDVAEIDEWGINGDRQWAVIDLATGYGLTAKREPELLYADASFVDGDVAIPLPTSPARSGPGRRPTSRCSDWLGRPVSLRRATPDRQRPTRSPPTSRPRARLAAAALAGPEGTFHDWRARGFDRRDSARSATGRHGGSA